MTRKLLRPHDLLAVDQTRRRFLRQAGIGLGAVGTVGLWGCSGDSDSSGGNGEAAAAASDDCPPAENSASRAAPTTTPRTVPPDMESSEYLWTGARCLFVTVPIAAVPEGPWLAPGLRLREPATATFFVARYPLTLFRSVYNEAAVFLHVEDSYGEARHCPWMVVDDDTALIYGRELLGFPKKLAVIDLTETDDRVVGTVTRHGTEVLRLEADRSQFAAEEGPVWGADRTVNVHGSIIGGMRLLDYPPLPEVIHEREVGTATITATSSERDPMGDLAPAAEGDAIWSVVDFAKLDMVPRLTDPALPFEWSYSMSLFSLRTQ